MRFEKVSHSGLKTGSHTGYKKKVIKRDTNEVLTWNSKIGPPHQRVKIYSLTWNSKMFF